jgi:hypothetical protein
MLGSRELYLVASLFGSYLCQPRVIVLCRKSLTVFCALNVYVLRRRMLAKVAGVTEDLPVKTPHLYVGPYLYSSSGSLSPI